MLISMHLMQIKAVNLVFVCIALTDLMYRNYFACPCTRSICPRLAIFNTKHAIVDLNNIYKFQATRKVFARIRVEKNRQAHKAN